MISRQSEENMRIDDSDPVAVHSLVSYKLARQPELVFAVPYPGAIGLRPLADRHHYMHYVEGNADVPNKGTSRCSV